MILRAATEADIAETARVAVASYGAGFASILEQPVLAGYDTAFFEKRFRDQLARLWVAEDEGRILGFLKLTDAHIDMLFVDPAAFGTGVGAAILRHAETLGATTLECFAENHAARAFYTRMGWRLARAYSREFAGRTRDFVWFERR